MVLRKIYIVQHIDRSISDYLSALGPSWSVIHVFKEMVKSTEANQFENHVLPVYFTVISNKIKYDKNATKIIW
jgi:hypothetical protein